MARQPRLILPGHAHLVRQRGHNGQAVVADGRDAETWLHTLREVSATYRVAVQGWCLGETSFSLMLTPEDESALSRTLQDLGRRYVGYFNARHGRSGTLWDGRFRCAALEPGPSTLTALLAIEVETPAEYGRSSRAHHVGESMATWLVDPPAYWALGNTPFDRHLAWQHLLERNLTRHERAAVEQALRSGIPLGRTEWLRQLQKQVSLNLFPQPRGRPKRPAAA